MAVRTDASTERSNWTTSLPAWNAFTVMVWVYITTNRGIANQQFIQIDNGGGTGFYYFHSDLTPNLSVNGTSTTGAAFSTGTWIHVALTGDGSNVRAYKDGVQLLSHGSTSITPVVMAIGGSSEWMDGRTAYAKVWDAALGVDEIAKEMWTARPQRFANLWGFFPMFDTVVTKDWSGNGHTITYNGTMTTVDGPPVGWGAAPLIVGRGPFVPPPYLPGRGFSVQQRMG